MLCGVGLRGFPTASTFLFEGPPGRWAGIKRPNSVFGASSVGCWHRFEDYRDLYSGGNVWGVVFLRYLPCEKEVFKAIVKAIPLLDQLVPVLRLRLHCYGRRRDERAERPGEPVHQPGPLVDRAVRLHRLRHRPIWGHHTCLACGPLLSKPTHCTKPPERHQQELIPIEKALNPRLRRLPGTQGFQASEGPDHESTSSHQLGFRV